MVVVRNGTDEIQNLPSHFDVLDTHERRTQLNPLVAGQKVHDGRGLCASVSVSVAVSVPVSGGYLNAVHPFVKETDRHGQNFRNFKQTAGADAIDSAFVFLDLLKRQTEQVSQTFLAHADEHAPEADAIADMRVNRISLFLRQLDPFP